MGTDLMNSTMGGLGTIDVKKAADKNTFSLLFRFF